MQFARKHWAVILLALLPLIPLWRCVFLGEVIGPWAQIRAMLPWGEALPNRPWDPLQADACLQFYGWRSLVFESWSHFRVPFWNPYELCGTVLLANSQSGGFYPLHIVAGILHLPAGFAITLLAWFHLAWAGLGVRKLALNMGANQEGGFLAGASFTLSAFMLSWVGLASVPTTVAWIPWILALGLELGPFRETRLPLAKLSVCVAMLLLGGHLQFAAYGLVGLIVLVVFRIVLRQAPIIALVPACVGLILGAALAAPQLGPVLQMSKVSHRVNVPSQEGYSSYEYAAIQEGELAAMVNPAALGDHTRFINDERTLSGSWLPFFKVGGNPAECALGVGGVLLILALLALRRQSSALPVAAVAVVGILLATPSFLTKAAYFLIPGWSATGSPGRAGVLFVLAICALAGAGWTRWHESEQTKKSQLVWSVLMLAIPFLVFGVLFFLPQIEFRDDLGFNPEALAHAAVYGALPIGFALSVLGLIGLLYRKARAPITFSFPLATYLGFGFFGLVTSGRPPTIPGGPEGRVAIIPGSWSLYQTPRALFPPNMATLGRFREAGGYDSLINRDYAITFGDANNGPTSPPENGNMMFVSPSANLERLQDLGVSEIWSASALPHLESKLDPRGFYVHPIPGHYADSAGHALKPMEQEPGDIELRVSGSDPVIVRERNLPGWKATIEGEAVPLNGPWLTVTPKGSGVHHIRFRYAPPMTLWLLMFVVGLGVTAWLVHKPVVK